MSSGLLRQTHRGRSNCSTLMNRVDLTLLLRLRLLLLLRLLLRLLLLPLLLLLLRAELLLLLGGICLLVAAFQADVLRRQCRRVLGLSDV